MSSEQERTWSEFDGTTGAGLSGFQAVVEEYEDEPDQCTIYPRDTSGVDRMSTWITALEGGFVDLRNCR